MKVTIKLKLQIYSYIVKKYTMRKNITDYQKVVNIVSDLVCRLVRDNLVIVDMDTNNIKNVIGIDKYVYFDKNLNHFNIYLM